MLYLTFLLLCGMAFICYLVLGEKSGLFLASLLTDCNSHDYWGSVTSSDSVASVS